MEKTARKFRCAECGFEFFQTPGDNALRCPECRGKTLILLEGEPIGKKRCSGNCSSGCSCCH